MQKLIASLFLTLLLPLFYIAPLSAESYTCRSKSVKHQFNISQGYPTGRKGYVIDHICPLACGGKDILANLQYQTILEGKNKDKWERTTTGCTLLCTPNNSTKTRQVFNCR